MGNRTGLAGSILSLSLALHPSLAGAMRPGTDSSGQAPDRTVLPIREPRYPSGKVLDVRNATPPPRFEIQAPREAPNVVIILIDDVGFGATSTFGGPVPTPTLDRLANEGLRYTNFHTAALSSPTRAALKSGRNHHTVNMAFITEMSTGFPGATGQVPNAAAPLAETLRLNGYSTAAFGKWHETAAWETSVSGPFDRWPTRQGFDKFYGFIGGETNQWSPLLYDGSIQVEPPKNRDYHLMTDMTNQAVSWVRYQKALTPGKPFFIYFAPGATHAPHHVPKEWIARWKGRFDQGWDKLREETLARQISMGIVPPDTKLAPKPRELRDWDTLSADEKRLFSRQAEVFAAFLEYTDHEIGRMLDAVMGTDGGENTLVFYIAGDNGTSGEGGQNGMVNEYTYFNGSQQSVPEMLKHIDRWGTPETYPHMAAGWSVAFDTPFGWMKQVASDFGGTRNGMVVRWPRGIRAENGIRSQFSHVIDVAPTILEAAGLPEPGIVNGTPQIPMQGISMTYTFDNPAAKERHTTQYFEIGGNRAIYHDGWFARTIHKAPWENRVRQPLDRDNWELYDTRSDFSLSRDLAAQEPKKLAELKKLFMKEAEKNHALPIDDRFIERAIAANVGRPDLMGNRKALTLGEGMTGMMENVFLNVKNRSKSIVAEIEVPEGRPANGALLAQGGRFGGWSLYVRNGIPAYSYNFLGQEHFTVAATEKLKPGRRTIRFDFAYDGGGAGRGGTGRLFVDGRKVGEGRIKRTQPTVFSADETADVGIDRGTPVSETIGSGEKSRFTGHISKITIEVGDTTPEEPRAADEDRRYDERLKVSAD